MSKFKVFYQKYISVNESTYQNGIFLFLCAKCYEFTTLLEQMI